MASDWGHNLRIEASRHTGRSVRTRTFSRKLIAACYFFQFAATVAWWVWMFNVPEHRALFFAPSTDEIILGKFSYPDLIVFGGCSLLTCFLAAFHRRSAPVLAWVTFGAALYACVGAFAVNWPLLQVPLADAMMVLTVVASLVFAVALGRCYE